LLTRKSGVSNAGSNGESAEKHLFADPKDKVFIMANLAEIENELIAGKDQQDIHPGDTVRVHVRIKEGAKTRIQVFEGTVIAMKHTGVRTTITVRKISNGVGVERIFPIYAPVVEKIEIKSRHRVRRAKLYYLRQLRGKKARLVEIRTAKKS